MHTRIVPIVTQSLLLVVAIAVLFHVYDFGQERFFTIDEYQFGHATWLVAQGDRPYVDFFEHHLPLSYVPHALFFLGEQADTPFSELALRLRKIVFGYILLASVLGVVATRTTTRDPYEALLVGSLPVAIGFGLMSAIDYRADSIAAFSFVSCLFLLEQNRRTRSRWLALSCGALAMMAAFMTQKIAAVGGATIALMYVFDLARRLLHRSLQRPARAEGLPSGTAGSPFIVSPHAFGLAAGAILALLIALAAALGMLREGYEITLLQAIEHESAYPRTSVSQYLAPFAKATWYTSVPILGFAFIYLISPSAGFWRCAFFVALAGGAMVKAQYPYNYIYLSFLIGLCAVRGYAHVIRKLPPSAALERVRPLLYLLPLAALPNQLAFVSHTTSNAHQLAILNKIQRYTTASDMVIDNAGGALFRRHASYYYHHGQFHRDLFKDYFEKDLIKDYLASAAPFWIFDSRYEQLPTSAQKYLRRHYLRVDGDLHTLGTVIRANLSQDTREYTIGIVRPGHYHLFPADEQERRARSEDPRNPAGPTGPTGIWIDGIQLTDAGVDLSRGAHRVSLAAGSPRSVLSILPPEAFVRGAPEAYAGTLPFSSFFEFGISHREKASLRLKQLENADPPSPSR